MTVRKTVGLTVQKKNDGTFGTNEIINKQRESTSPKIKYFPIVFDIDSINKDTKYIYCTPLISPTPTDKNIIIFQLKPFEQYIYYRNKQLDGMNNVYDNNTVSLPS